VSLLAVASRAALTEEELRVPPPATVDDALGSVALNTSRNWVSKRKVVEGALDWRSRDARTTTAWDDNSRTVGFALCQFVASTILTKYCVKMTSVLLTYAWSVWTRPALTGVTVARAEGVAKGAGASSSGGDAGEFGSSSAAP
jgi:hypothetical protein